MKRKSLLFLFLGALGVVSCGEISNNSNAIQALAEKHVEKLEAPELLEEFLLSVNNDTIAVCYTLGLPKPSLERLMNEDTYPSKGGLCKIRECLVKRYVLGTAYTDSCKYLSEEGKDWLMNNSSNEPINPIWELVVNEDF